MKVFGLLLAGCMAMAFARVPGSRPQTFALQIGPPVAAMPAVAGAAVTKVSKSIVFVVRSVGCDDPSSVQYTATAEGIVDGIRRTWPLPMVPLSPAGVVGATKTWPEREPWVASVSASCGTGQAGALVRIAGGIYRRDAVELVPGPPTRVELERALALLTGDVSAAAR